MGVKMRSIRAVVCLDIDLPDKSISEVIIIIENMIYKELREVAKFNILSVESISS